MSQTDIKHRIQLMRGESRWAARRADRPEVVYVGRSCAEAVGKLLIAEKEEFGALLSAYAGSDKRHVPTSEPAVGIYKQTILQEIIAEGSLPPLWTTGPRGRDSWYSVPHPRHAHKQQATEGE